MKKRDHETSIKIDSDRREAFLLAIAMINTSHQMALANDVCPACLFGAVIQLLENMPDHVVEELHKQRGKEALEQALKAPLLRAEKFTEDFETEGNA